LKSGDRLFFCVKASWDGETGFRRRSILSILTSFFVLSALRYRSFFDNPIKPFEGDNWNSIFDKNGGKVVKIFEKSVFLVVKFDNFG
jgi:hypothetical protein